MSEFNNPSLNPDEMAKAFDAELEAFPIAQTVMARVRLVAGNLSALAPTIEADITSTIPESVLQAAHLNQLKYFVEAAQYQAESSETALLHAPRHAATQGLQLMRTVLTNYTPYVPALFEGYAPVADDLDWAAKLGDGTISAFGRMQEQYILLAEELAAEGSYDCRTEADLQIAAYRRGLITSPLGPHPFEGVE